MNRSAGNANGAENDSSGWTTMPCTLDEGPAPRAAIGLIVLTTDMVIEPEMYTFLPRDGVSLYSARIHKDKGVSAETIRAMEDDLTRTATQILPGDHLDVIAFGCASCTTAIGEGRVAALLQKARSGVAVTDAITASLKGLEALGVRRIAMLTPWPDDVNEVAGSYVAEHGFEVAAKGSFKQAVDGKIHRVPPRAVYQAGLELGRRKVDGLLISGTGLRVASVLGELEEDLGKPVVTSTQSLAWHSLRLAGYQEPVRGFGRLLTV